MHRIVDGSTRILGIVGDPIRQVRAPEVWSALFKANDFNAICVPLHVEPAELEVFLAGLRNVQNVMGLIVTIPHKPAAVHHADALTDRAQRVQSVNVMRNYGDSALNWRTFAAVAASPRVVARIKLQRGLSALSP